MASFKEMYEARYAAGKYVDVGLDPDVSQIPNIVAGDGVGYKVYNFLCGIVDATHHVASSYKIQIAYFEDAVFKGEGHKLVKRLVDYIRNRYPEIPIILDFKRGDILRTNEPYARFAFDYLGVDAVTVHPYLGMEAMQPFLVYADKTIIVLCHTSNPGAGEFQDLQCTFYINRVDGKYYSTYKQAAVERGVEEEDIDPNDYGRSTLPLYLFVAARIAQSWNEHGNCALVVGATYPQELAKVREVVGDDVYILIPGFGSQGAKPADAVPNAVNHEGGGAIYNNASAILFAYNKLTNEDGSKKYTAGQYAAAATEAAETMNNQVAAALAA